VLLTAKVGQAQAGLDPLNAPFLIGGIRHKGR